MECEISGCDNDTRSSGLCNKHYQRKRRNGDPCLMHREMHGMFGTPEYNSWASMKDRCYNSKHQAYAKYGGKGIEVCSDWRDSFVKFYEDMGDRPDGKSLDRIDNTEGYYPGNCRWATRTEQARNRGTRKLSKSNTIGVSGIFRRGDKYRSTLYGKYIGEYKNMDEAISARLSAENGVPF